MLIPAIKSQSIFWVLKKMASLHKYPQYLADIYVYVIMQPVWRHRGVIIGNKIVWLGCPIITLVDTSTIRIGNNSHFCSRSTHTALGVNHPVIFRTLKPRAELIIGSGVRMSGTTICTAKRISIGDRCVIGANTTITDTDFHSLNSAIRNSVMDSKHALNAPVEIGNDVFVGCNCSILKGVSIGDGAIIGACSVVSRDVPPSAVVAGNPAIVVGKSEARSNKATIFDYKKADTL